jgi:hypothetical protein
VNQNINVEYWSYLVVLGRPALRPSAIKPIDIILRSKHLKNYILYPVLSFRRRQESNSYKYFLDSPVKPGNDGGGGYRIPGPALALKLMFSLSGSMEKYLGLIIGHIAPGQASRGMTAVVNTGSLA